MPSRSKSAASTQQRRRCWLVLGLVVALIAIGLGWFTIREQPVPDGPATAAALSAAVTDGDAQLFEAQFVSDSGQRARLLWGNLSQLAAAEFATQGPDQWQVSWRLPGEDAPSTHLLRPVWHCDWRACLLTDLIQQPGEPTPIWLTTQTTVATRGAVTIIGPAAASSWLAPANAALQAIQQDAPAGLLAAEATNVIEVPADRGGFEQVMAAPATEFATMGAITWARGDSSHIVLNPEASASLNPEQQRLLIAHELVHLATAGLGAPAPGQLWVSEGLAEALSLPLSADEQARSRAVLAAGCPLPIEPPADASFSDPTVQQFAYAWSGATVGALLDAGATAQSITELWQTSGAQPTSWPPLAICD